MLIKSIPLNVSANDVMAFCGYDYDEDRLDLIFWRYSILAIGRDPIDFGHWAAR